MTEMTLVLFLIFINSENDLFIFYLTAEVTFSMKEIDNFEFDSIILKF